MDLYEVYTKGITNYSYDEPPEPCDYWGLVIHETRGKAKYMGYIDFNDSMMFYYCLAEFTDMRSRLIKKDVDGPARLVTDDIKYSRLVCQREHGIDNCIDCEEDCNGY